jgi:acetylornithine deacetylase/succinyl-diaminopimelate desuccinylase-like protein
MAEETALAGSSLGSEAAALLSELIRIDTSNPPGNERPAQELLAARLEDAGFECELIGARPERPNLVGRLPGEAPGERLLLLGHVDTVPADPAEWTFDPWSGELVDGEVLGRGALDMKGQVAAEVAGAIALARSGWRPARGELKIVTTVDEEKGGEFGAAWLCAEHPEAVRAEMVVNEGGGSAFEVSGQRFYTLCAGEKGINRFLLRARGVAGHASIPGLGDNALLKLAPALERLREQPPLEATPDGVRFVESVLGEELRGTDPSALAAAVERLRGLSPQLVTLLAEPMLRITMVPTRVRASEKANVIPARAEALVDCRVPPGGGPDEVRAVLGDVLGPLVDQIEVDFDGQEQIVGNSSPVKSPLADAIAAWLAESDPEAKLVPTVMQGFSDSHPFRRAFPEATVYGFCPHRKYGLLESWPLIHAADERAAVEDLELAAGFFADLAKRVLG